MTAQPFADQPDVGTADGVEPDGPAGHTILVADDDEDIRDLTTYTLRGAGYRIIEAADGHAALDLIDSAQPDLVILDISMPGMDGLSVSHHMHRSTTTEDIPVIMLSSRGAPGDVDLGYVRGADHYLIKPADPTILLQRVRELLSGRPANAGNP